MLAKPKIYLDSNATYPLSTAAKAAVLAFLEGPQAGNPSSIHTQGRQAKKYLNFAREQVAASISSPSRRVDTEQIVFTSGGSEANQLAIRSALEDRLLRGVLTHWILSSIEHDANIQMIAWARARGAIVELIPVDSNGVVILDKLNALLRPETALISLIWVNNETGVIQPVESVSKISKEKKIPFHVDAAQAWGKLPIDALALDAQYLTFSGQKIGALAGSGFICLGSGIQIQSTVLGKQEKGRRGGTESVLAQFSMGAASQNLKILDTTQFRNELEAKLKTQVSDLIINGEQVTRVSNTSSLTFLQIETETLLMALDIAGFSASAGSACSSGVLSPSHVLLAMGRTPSQALSSLRISLSEHNTLEEIDAFVNTISQILRKKNEIHA